LDLGDPTLPTFQGADRIALEQHPYFAFNGEGSEDVVPYIPQPCSGWESMMSQTAFGVTTAGEWSLGFNDCGLFLHTTADDHVTQNCTEWNMWEDYTETQKQNLMSFAMSNMDALQVGYSGFFWIFD
jgi:glucan 1,3-beta-glucosidase